MTLEELAERLKTGRNDDCPCGSGKKYKKCHLNDDEAAYREEKKKQEEAVAESKAAAQGEDDEVYRETFTKEKSAPRMNKVRQNVPKNIPRRAGI